MNEPYHQELATSFWHEYWIRARACLIWIFKSWFKPASSEASWEQDIGKKHWG